LKQHINDKEVKYDLGCLDPELVHPTGGTGIFTRDANIIKAQPKTKRLKALLSSGRVGMHTIAISNNCFVLVYEVYGITNGDNDDEAANRTSFLLDAILDDAAERDKIPILIAGDFNASLNRLPSLCALVENGSLHDIGANGSKYGSIDNLNTCKVDELTPGTRRDYIIANPIAEALIQRFQVTWHKGIKTHAVLEVHFKLCIEPHNYEAVVMPTSISDILHDVCS
jgi:hypothetical protein